MLCALALAVLALLPSSRSRGTARPHAEKPQMQWEHSLSSSSLQRTVLQILRDCPQSLRDSFIPQRTVSAQAQTVKASDYVFHHSLGFSSVLRETIIPVLPKRLSPSLSCGDILPFYKKLIVPFVQFIF